MAKILLLALISISIPAAWGQSVISAKSGTIHHVDGKAHISGVNLKPLKTGEFPALEQGQILSTEDAHAEVLLSPGVFLRLGPNSEVKLIRNDITDTELHLLKGAALVEAGEVVKDTRTILVVGPYRATISKIGLYRFDAEPDRIRVIDGRLDVTLTADGPTARPLELKRGRQVEAGAILTAKFNAKASDELFAWSRNRSALVAMGNATAARAAGSQGKGFRNSRTGSWVFLPTMGFYTYLPGRGMYSSPFGFNYFSPMQYWNYYYAPVQQSGGYQAQNAGPTPGYASATGRGDTGGGYSGGAAAASSPSFGGAASASAPALSNAGATMPTGGTRR
jgi:hypothetical protein